ncbi:hypothetical protein NDU88_004605 [Pleurodeles waltl]|uniref:Reverse transcriptase domain-containing protein n=1 Tax=Pleurodeles waltl TaxID=8319 RepID=A0AAV7WSC7_PLEWA|nr:hypothetical protein NDU88_004605 [Pleurodeles waltl]
MSIDRLHEIHQKYPKALKLAKKWRDDRSGRLLAQILRWKLPGTLVLHLTNPQGGEERTQRDIVTVFRDHLERVYANPGDPERGSLMECLTRAVLPQLGGTAVQMLDSDLTLEEVKVAIKYFPLDKHPPGSDGFTAELYQAFGIELAPQLLEVYNEALTADESMGEGLIAMIPKPGRLPLIQRPKPITMINLDVKILRKILTTRPDPEVTRLVQPEQCGFIPGRNMTMNIRRLIHVLHEVEDREDELALVLRLLAIIWMNTQGPSVKGWLKDVKEWAVAEEMQLGQVRRDDNLGEDIQTWQEILTRMAEVEEPGHCVPTGLGAHRCSDDVIREIT